MLARVLALSVRIAAIAALLWLAASWGAPFAVGYRSWIAAAALVTGTALVIHSGRALRFRKLGLGARALEWLAITASSLAIVMLMVAMTSARRLRERILDTAPERFEHVGRHVIVGYLDPEEVRRLARLGAIGGVFITRRNMQGKSKDAIRAEIASFQDARRPGTPPLWIATDQEGGVVSRASPPLTTLPPLAELAERHAHDDAPGDDELEREVSRYGEVHGRELADLGIDLNFAPVVDLNHGVIDPDDRYSRIYSRAISSDPRLVTRVARTYCAALGRADVHCTLKHFPGLGRVLGDTHLRDASLRSTREELERSDWLPFRELMNEGPFTMLGHARLAALDPAHPASFSRAVVADLLRGEWRHGGVLITDDFAMNAVYEHEAGIGAASVESLRAGVDLVLISYDPALVYPILQALLEAGASGTLEPALLERSAERLDHARGAP